MEISQVLDEFKENKSNMDFKNIQRSNIETIHSPLLTLFLLI